MCRILLVDDEENILHALRRSLAAEGYEIESYDCPKTALKRAQTITFSLAITDYRMPGMDGVFFLTALKHLQPDAARIMLSAYADLDGLLGAINEARIFRFITKPWLDYDLKTTVAHALNHQKILAENRRLADQVRAQQEELARQRKAIEQLEQVYPGITRVVRDQDDAIILAD